jgi:hypothetical protein
VYHGGMANSASQGQRGLRKLWRAVVLHLKLLALFLLPFAFILTMVVGYGGYLYVSSVKGLNESGARDAQEGVLQLAAELRRSAGSSPLPESLKPEELMEWNVYPPDLLWRYGKMDYMGYTIELRGEHPKYSGTTIRYLGDRRTQPEIILTVHQLDEGDWTVHEFFSPGPWWWRYLLG